MSSIWPALLMLLAVAIPTVWAGVLLPFGRRLGTPLSGYGASVAGVLSVAMVLCGLVTWLGSAGEWGYGGRPVVRTMSWVSLPSIGLIVGVHVDSLACASAVVVSIVSCLVTLLTVADTRRDLRSHRQFQSLGVMTSAGLLACVSPSLLQLLACGWVVLFGAWLSASHDAGDRHRARRGGGVLLVASLGAVLLMIACVLLVNDRGGTTLGALANPMPRTIGLFVLAGTGVWIGLFPAQGWMDRLAPAPAGPRVLASLLPGAVGMLILLRVATSLDTDTRLAGVLLSIVSLTLLLPAMIAQRDLARLVPIVGGVIHLVSAIAVLMGGAVTGAIVWLTLLLAGSAVMISMAAVSRATRGTSEFARLGGLILRLPVTACVFAGSVLLLVGIPYLGASSGWIALQDALQQLASDQPGWITGLLVGLPVVVTVLLTIALTRAWMLTHFGRQRHLRTHARAAESTLAWGAAGAAMVFAAVCAQPWFPMQSLITQQPRETHWLVHNAPPERAVTRPSELLDEVEIEETAVSAVQYAWGSGVLVASAIWWRGGRTVRRVMSNPAPAALATALREQACFDDLYRAVPGGLMRAAGSAVGQADEIASEQTAHLGTQALRVPVGIVTLLDDAIAGSDAPGGHRAWIVLAVGSVVVGVAIAILVVVA